MEKIPCEAFVLQEVMTTQKFYDKYRALLILLSTENPSTRSSTDLLVLRIFIALYGDEVADQIFTVFHENRKSMPSNPLSEMELYGTDKSQRQLHFAPSPSIPALLPETVCTLKMDQMRSIMPIMFSGDNNAIQNSNPSEKPVGDLSNHTPNPTTILPLGPNI